MCKNILGQYKVNVGFPNDDLENKLWFKVRRSQMRVEKIMGLGQERVMGNMRQKRLEFKAN